MTNSLTWVKDKYLCYDLITIYYIFNINQIVYVEKTTPLLSPKTNSLKCHYADQNLRFIVVVAMCLAFI